MSIFEDIYCYKCHILFGVMAGHKNKLVEIGEVFYCPSGHSQCFTESTQSKLDKLREELQKEKIKIENSYRREDSLRKRLAATKGYITKLKKKEWKKVKRSVPNAARISRKTGVF